MSQIRVAKLEVVAYLVSPLDEVLTLGVLKDVFPHLGSGAYLLSDALLVESFLSKSPSFYELEI